MDPDPPIFANDLQEANQKYFKKFFSLLVFEGTFTSFFKDKTWGGGGVPLYL
jgi:hypothetical protein